MKSGFGKIFKCLREEKGIRQSDLGKVFDVANTTISSWERGNSEPSLEQLKVIAKYFKVTIGFLLGVEES
jgi:transcriptional regulator with XRE-family HTH domain